MANNITTKHIIRQLAVPFGQPIRFNEAHSGHDLTETGYRYWQPVCDVAAFRHYILGSLRNAETIQKFNNSNNKWTETEKIHSCH